MVGSTNIACRVGGAPERWVVFGYRISMSVSPLSMRLSMSGSIGSNQPGNALREQFPILSQTIRGAAVSIRARFGKSSSLVMMMAYCSSA